MNWIILYFHYHEVYCYIRKTKIRLIWEPNNKGNDLWSKFQTTGNTTLLYTSLVNNAASSVHNQIGLDHLSVTIPNHCNFFAPLTIVSCTYNNTVLSRHPCSHLSNVIRISIFIWTYILTDDYFKAPLNIGTNVAVIPHQICKCYQLIPRNPGAQRGYLLSTTVSKLESMDRRQLAYPAWLNLSLTMGAITSWVYWYVTIFCCMLPLFPYEYFPVSNITTIKAVWFNKNKG